MRQILDDTEASRRKKKSMASLVERYYGKRDILAAWEEKPDKADHDYLRDLRRRVRTHENDIMYRGGDIGTE